MLVYLFLLSMKRVEGTSGIDPNFIDYIQHINQRYGRNVDLDDENRNQQHSPSPPRRAVSSPPPPPAQPIGRPIEVP